jgi:hypothetical protein
MNETLMNWKAKLENERDEILKRQRIIETRLERNKLMWEITQDIEEEKRGPITESTSKSLKSTEEELINFKNDNDPKLDEIVALLNVVERKLMIKN